MRFKAPLDAMAQERVELCNAKLLDPERLSWLERTGLMDSAQELAFDRLASLAARILNVPLTIVSLIGLEKQFFKAGYGLPAPYDVLRAVPIGESICRYTLNNSEIIVSDTRVDPLLMWHPTTEPWGIGAFMAIPMTLDNGHVLGAFCAVDPKPRQWTDHDVYVMRELTASVMTEINNKLQILELRAEKELREKFAIALSHDLRNPLNVIKMSAEILQCEGPTEDTTMLADMIVANADRADHMIQDLLNASRLRAGEKLSSELCAGDLVGIVNPVIESLMRMHKRHFILESPPRLQGNWNAESIRRIIENLSGNAVKYGASEAPITIGLRERDDLVEISVHNTGAAIPEAQLGKLFNLFERAPSAVLGAQNGWGVGLTVVRSLTEEMGGTITVKSLPELGTTFTIVLAKYPAV